MSGATRELIVKVKLVSDNTNPFPSPVASSVANTPGSSPGTSAGWGFVGSIGNPAAASPLLHAEREHQKRMQEHSQSLTKLTDHITKAATGFAYLSGSASGFTKALEKAANVLATISVAGSGISAAGSLFKGSTWRAAGAMLTNPATLLAGGAAVGAGMIGYGLYSGTESGQSYFGGFNKWRSETFGGGKVNSRGQWISQDQQLATIHGQHADRMRQAAMQAPHEAILREGRERNYQNEDLLRLAKIRGQSFSGYAGNARIGEGKLMGLLDDNLATSRNSYEAFYGKEIGARMAEQDRHGVLIQSQQYGTEYASVLQQAKESKLVGNKLQSDLFRAQQNYSESANKRNPSMIQGGIITEGMLEEHQKVLKIQEDISKNKQQQLELDKKIADISTKAAEMKKADSENRLSMNRNFLSNATQSLEGMKQAFGMMEQGDQQYILNIAERYKKHGFESLPADERSILMQTPLAEDVKMKAIEKGESGIAEMLKGTRMEANMQRAQNETARLEKLTVEMKQEIAAKIEFNEQRLAEKIAEYMGPIIAKVTLSINKGVQMAEAALDQQDRLGAMQQGQANK